jgi:hypothetical protein
MDPYLENSDLWLGFHNQLIAAIAGELSPRLRPRYYVAVEGRTFWDNTGDLKFAGRPDISIARSTARETTAEYIVTPHAQVVPVTLPIPDEITETYLEIRAVGEDRVITVLEILSPTNKRRGRGREMYEEKRDLVLTTRTHLVEIDLLRGGEPMRMNQNGSRSHYRILISRAPKRPRADLYPFNVQQPIPDFDLPLQRDDAEPRVELNRILHELYDRAGYDLRINYKTDPEPPLDGDDAIWLDNLLREAKFR